MELRNDQELANTREKLRMLEEEYEATRNDSAEEAAIRGAAMRSLKRLINQLNEEIARYEARQAVRR